MTTRARSRARRPHGDDGAAMLIVMGWGLLMMGLVLVVSQTVINQIVPWKSMREVAWETLK